jgi:hypothetical protein
MVTYYHGTRIRLCRLSDLSIAVDYCAGKDEGLALMILAAVVMILKDVDENIPIREIERMFPIYTIKPIDKDPYCWKRLREMAGLSEL